MCVRVRKNDVAQTATCCIHENRKNSPQARCCSGQNSFSHFSIALDLKHWRRRNSALATKHAKAIAPTYETALGVALLEVVIAWRTGPKSSIHFVRNPETKIFPYVSILRPQLLLDAKRVSSAARIFRNQIHLDWSFTGRRANTCQVDEHRPRRHSCSEHTAPEAKPTRSRRARLRSNGIVQDTRWVTAPLLPCLAPAGERRCVP